MAGRAVACVKFSLECPRRREYPEKTGVPVGRLLSEKYAGELAARVSAATKERRPLPLRTSR